MEMYDGDVEMYDMGYFKNGNVRWSSLRYQPFQNHLDYLHKLDIVEGED